MVFEYFKGGAYLGTVSASSAKEARKKMRPHYGPVKLMPVGTFQALRRADEMGAGDRRATIRDIFKRNPRRFSGCSTTLRNMAVITVTKQRNGVVKITGRKMAGNPAPRLPKHATFKVVKTYGGYIITKNGRKVDGPWNLWEARSRAKQLKEQNRRDVDMFGQW